MTAAVPVSYTHLLIAIEELGAFAHEFHAAQDDGLLRQGLGELCEVERIAHVIGDGLHLGLDIVMRKYHRVAL